MTEGKLEAFLKLFCITESRHGSFEPNWQSWIVLCLCMVSAVATASSGAYFHHNNAVKSSVICFTVSAMGCGMAMVTIIAILMGCKRRRRSSLPLRNDEELTIYSNPAIMEQRTCTQIEHQDPVASRLENQLWMNPAFMEYDKSLYEADWHLGKSFGKTLERDETDFDARDSDDFYSSSDTVTCSHRSYSDDEGYFQNSSREINVKETGKCLLQRQDNRFVPAQDVLESGQAVENVSVPGTSCDSNGKLSVFLQNSNQFNLTNLHKGNSDLSPNILNSPLIIPKRTKHFQTKSTPNENSNLIKNTSDLYSSDEKHELYLDLIEHESIFYRSSAEFQNSSQRDKSKKLVTKKLSSVYKGRNKEACLKNSLYYEDNCVTSRCTETDNFPKFVDTQKNNLTENVLLHKGLNSSERSAKCHSNRKSSMSNNHNFSTVVNVEDDYKPTIKRECSLPTKTLMYPNTLASMTQKTHPAIGKRSYSVPLYQSHFSNVQTRQSRKKLDLPANFPSLPYPILPKKPSKSHSKNQRSSKNENAFIPMYEKRPLLDMNGMPISQKEMVKALTGLLTNGLQQLPIHPMEQKEQQAFQLGIESLQPIPC